MLDEVRKKRDSEIANKEAMASAINFGKSRRGGGQSQNRPRPRPTYKSPQAETAIARRQHEELDVLINYATLKCSVCGNRDRAVRSIPGDLVREGSEVGKGEPLFVISQMETVRVHIPVPEADAALVSRGDAVALNFPSFPAEEADQGDVTRLSGDLDPSTRTMLVEVEVTNPDRKLIPGMFGAGHDLRFPPKSPPTCFRPERFALTNPVKPMFTSWGTTRP